MRSVVVVLPASMWAMMPMLRTLFRSVSTSCATGFLRKVESEGCRPGAALLGITPGRPDLLPAARCLPAVVGEGLVRLGHLVRVLAALDSGAETVGRVQDLVLETLGHRLLTTTLGVAGEPAERQGVGAVRLDLDRHLVGRATDTAAADLEGRTDVVESLLQHDDRILTGLGADALERVIDDALGEALLAVEEDLVDELPDGRRAVHRVGDDGALGSGTLARHSFFSIFAP